MAAEVAFPYQATRIPHQATRIPHQATRIPHQATRIPGAGQGWIHRGGLQTVPANPLQPVGSFGATDFFQPAAW
jgi:hypothetical protein